MSSIRLSTVKSKTSVEGPGVRYAIWVQGCPIHCKGCFNQHTWNFKGGYESKVDELWLDIKRMKNEHPEIEGVTFLGGEPFEQALALAELAERVRAYGLGIMTFTGYEYSQILKSPRKDWSRLLDLTDLLIDGPYIENQHDLSRPWVGSKNQQYRFLTDRYQDYEAKLHHIMNKLEIRLYPDGKISANGMAGLLDLKMLESLIERSDITVKKEGES